MNFHYNLSQTPDFFEPSESIFNPISTPVPTDSSLVTESQKIQYDLQQKISQSINKIKKDYINSDLYFNDLLQELLHLEVSKTRDPHVNSFRFSLNYLDENVCSLLKQHIPKAWSLLTNPIVYPEFIAEVKNEPCDYTRLIKIAIEINSYIKRKLYYKLDNLKEQALDLKNRGSYSHYLTSENENQNVINSAAILPFDESNRPFELASLSSNACLFLNSNETAGYQTPEDFPVTPILTTVYSTDEVLLETQSSTQPIHRLTSSQPVLLNQRKISLKPQRMQKARKPSTLIVDEHQLIDLTRNDKNDYNPFYNSFESSKTIDHRKRMDLLMKTFVIDKHSGKLTGKPLYTIEE